MCIGAAGAHLGGNPDRLHQFLLSRAGAQRRFGVTLDAMWARCTCAMATAIIRLNFAGSAPSANTASPNASSAACRAGASARRRSANCLIAGGYVLSLIAVLDFTYRNMESGSELTRRLVGTHRSQALRHGHRSMGMATGVRPGPTSGSVRMPESNSASSNNRPRTSGARLPDFAFPPRK